jgi:CRISPR-associated exonuclease Cas4
MGRLIHETTYQSRTDRFKELAIDGIKLDYYDRKSKVIHEVKKSDSFSDAHVWQVKYYIYVLEQNGITGVSGILEYPKLHRTENVNLGEADRLQIPVMLSEIERIAVSESSPDRLKVSKCRNCSYFDFCWSGEEDT